MKQHKLTNQDVVQRTQIHRNVITRIRYNKQKRIDLDVLTRLVIGLNCTPNDLLRLEYDSEYHEGEEY